MSTPTPKEEEKYLLTNPNVRGLYPWSDRNLARIKIYELGTKYAKRLRFAGLIGLILTLIIAICTFVPFPVLDKSHHRVVICGFSFTIVLWMLRIVEKGTWPFDKKKDEG
jgi:hypothetical protein